jgi:hypothetical protein
MEGACKLMDSEASIEILPDHCGDSYVSILERLHEVLKPKSYLEIGVAFGETLKLARCASIGIDPEFKLHQAEHMGDILKKPELFLFQTGSDDFFAVRSPLSILGRPVDLAFLDGMHRCEYLLRDFINTEKFCKPNSVVALHDCLPLEVSMTTRGTDDVGPISPNRLGWWTGDVWRTALLLRRRRPDLDFTVLDAAPTGLILITNLNPANTSLSDDYNSCLRQMLSWKLKEIGLQEFFLEMQVESTTVVATDEAITARFWL